MKSRVAVGVAVGTRPEAIKLIPVVQELSKFPKRFHVCLIATSQHREMLWQVLDTFAIKADVDLAVMEVNQSLNGVAVRIVSKMETLLNGLHLDCMIVQGDSTSALAVGLSAFHAKVPVIHVEAGLRTGDVRAPFPEEVNRKLLAAIAEVHFAPTEKARLNLVSENISSSKIAVTGNTVVDALRLLDNQHNLRPSLPFEIPDNGKQILILTVHRRESWGNNLDQICRAVAQLVDKLPQIRVVCPMHLNPNVSEKIKAELGTKERIHLLPPMEYPAFLSLLKRSDLILTDSGGVQEEASTLGKRVLILRDTTERPEALACGLAHIVGTVSDCIVKMAIDLLKEPIKPCGDAFQNPFGDGCAAGRIVKGLDRWLEGKSPLLEARDEFRALSSGVI